MVKHRSARVTSWRFAADPNHSTSVFFVFSWRRLDAHQLERAAIHSCMFDVIRHAFRGLTLTSPCMSSANRWYITRLNSTPVDSEDASDVLQPTVITWVLSSM